MPSKRLGRTFFARDTHVVAKALLGKILVRRVAGENFSGRITEVESYVGMDDAACHAARGRTKRTEIMFGEAGHAYVYLIYGIYHCLNIVTEEKDFPAAVLIRSLDAVNGPGRLTRALKITRTMNGADLTTSQYLYLVDDGWRVAPTAIRMTPRIGVAYAGNDALLPWRYVLTQNGRPDFSGQLFCGE